MLLLFSPIVWYVGELGESNVVEPTYCALAGIVSC